MKPTHSSIIYNCNLYLSRLDNLKGIYEGSSCEFKYGNGWKYECEKEAYMIEYLICEF